MADSSKLSIGRNAMLLDMANIIVLLLLFALAIFYYSQLPPEIPIRFDANGAPIAYRAKATLFVLPSLALLISIILFLIRRQPNMINYPVEVTDENEAALYRESSLLISGITLAANVLILYGCWTIVQVALERSANSNMLFIWIPVVLMVILSFRAYQRMKKLG